jgi:hypothetical protein
MVPVRATLIGLTLATAAFALAAAAFFAEATRLASARFVLCGPSALSAANLWCRSGAGYLRVAMVLGFVAIGLGLLTLWVVRRHRNRQHRPTAARRV